jgi:hypothetical protein
MKKELFYISAHFPSNRVPVAGQKLCWTHLQKLAKEYEVHLFSYVNDLEAKYFNEEDFCFCKSIYFYRLTDKIRFKNYIKNINLPVKISGRYDRKAIQYIITIIREKKISIVHIEFTSLIYLGKILKEIFPKLEIVIVQHDVTFQALKRISENALNPLKKGLFLFEYFRQKKYELSNLVFFDKIYVLNEKDKIILENFDLEKPIQVWYPDMGTIVNRKEVLIEPYSIMFLGAMHRKENIDAVNWFIDDILPTLSETFTALNFYIVGSNPSPKIKTASNVIITGFVEDLNDYFSKTDIAVVPLRMGAGISIKTIEMQKAGLPIFSTNVGLEGVIKDKSKILIQVDTVEEFIDAISNYFNKKYNS